MAEAVEVPDGELGRGGEIESDAVDAGQGDIVAEGDDGVAAFRDGLDERGVRRADEDEFLHGAGRDRMRQAVWLGGIVERFIVKSNGDALERLRDGGQRGGGDAGDKRVGEPACVFAGNEERELAQLGIHADDGAQIVWQIAHLAADFENPLAGFFTDADAVVAII